MTSAAPISVVLRAFAILRALNVRPVSTVEDLHQETGLPKATIVRLLRTLEHDKLVYRAHHGSYYLTSAVSELASGYHRAPLLSEAVAPVADALTDRVQWPISLALPEGTEMVVRYATTSRSPLAFFHSALGMRLGMLRYAMGRAYVAHCSEDVQQIFIEQDLSGEEEAVRKVKAELLRREMADIRERGYALREAKNKHEPSTLAVPVFHAGKCAGALALTWFTSAMNARQVVSRYAEDLRQASAEVTKRADALAQSYNVSDQIP